MLSTSLACPQDKKSCKINNSRGSTESTGRTGGRILLQNDCRGNSWNTNKKIPITAYTDNKSVI